MNNTICLVEDEANVRSAIGWYLRDKGYHIVEFRSAEPCLKAMRQRGFSPHLVISDYGLPGMTGGDFARQVKAMHPAVPIVMITGYRKVACDWCDVIEEKPLQLSLLALTVERLMGGKVDS